MEPWEQEWYYNRALERKAEARPRCVRCGDVLEEADALLYDGACRYCLRVEDDD